MLSTNITLTQIMITSILQHILFMQSMQWIKLIPIGHCIAPLIKSYQIAWNISNSSLYYKRRQVTNYSISICCGISSGLDPSPSVSSIAMPEASTVLVTHSLSGSSSKSSLRNLQTSHPGKQLAPKDESNMLISGTTVHSVTRIIIRT